MKGLIQYITITSLFCTKLTTDKQICSQNGSSINMILANNVNSRQAEEVTYILYIIAYNIQSSSDGYSGMINIKLSL